MKGQLFCIILACAVSAAYGGEKIRPPTDAELKDLVGETLPHPIKSVKWQANEPPKTNLIIYATSPKAYQPELFKFLADFLGMKSHIQRMPADIIYFPGYWIKEADSTNKATLAFSEISGMIRYGSGEDNHKWDLKNHKPLVQGVPDEKEALQRTLALLPVLGITTNDLEHLPDGQLKYACNTEGTWYNDRHDNLKEKRYIRQINIEFWQRIRDGVSVLSIGGGGMLRAGYISDGHLAEFEMTFRQVIPNGDATSKTSKEIVKLLQKGQGRTFRAYIPDKLTITNCSLIYPEANSTKKQEFLWPFYSLDAVTVEEGVTNWFRIYEPLSW